MGYIPPESISSEKALKLLRYMNTSLSIRLNVHEDLPRPMQKWRVESGRATFIVDEEFELDLISFVEDTSDQWHFIDLRLLFSPAPSITVGSYTQLHLKDLVNEILRANGVNGLDECFKWLHNFILTHKINVLRSQAHELVRAGWTGSLKIESVHRGLVIQYWIDKPGKKNWIEIGLNSNKPKNGKASWRGPPVSSLAVRWFRQGVLMKDADLHFDWKNLSVERILKHVIARHIAHLLRTTHQTLNPAITTKVTFSESEPSECVVEASMGSANMTTLSVEPVTGNYILQPITSQSSAAENALNRPQEASNTGSIMTRLLARSVVERVKKIAQQIGWRSITRQSLRLDTVKEAVKQDVSEFVLFWPRAWTSTWALAAIVDASGESWWIFELGSKGSAVESARRIAIEGPEGQAPPVNRTTLTGIGRIAVHTLAYHVTARTLDRQGKAYSLGNEFAQCRHNSASRGVVRGWVLHLKTGDLLASKPGEPHWLEPAMRVMCQGLRSDSRDVWHIASGTMLPDAAAEMRRLMSASPQKNFSFSEGGNFHILLSTPFGEEVVTELKARLRDLDRLRSFATILEKRRMPLKSSSLQQVQFQYSQHLTATVNFDEGDNVKVHFGNKNPHKRIESFLADMVNEKIGSTERLPLDGNSALDKFCTTLLLTRPLLSTLEAIAIQQPGNYKNPAIHPHAVGTYRITYANPICSFDIRLRPKEDKALWVIEDNESKSPDFRPKDERTSSFRRPETLKAALQKLYKESGERWYGVRTGIVADIDGIPEALKRLHESVLSCYVEDSVKQELGNSGPPTATGAPTGQSNNNKGPVPKLSGGSAPNGMSAPNGKMLPGKANGAGSKPATGVKREVITID
jgi:mediator of RNA polymerase II transcription subunit 14